MAITSIEATYLDIPLPADFFPSWIPGRTQSDNRCVVVEVSDDSGQVGIGTGVEQQSNHFSISCPRSQPQWCAAAGLILIVEQLLPKVDTQ